MSMLRSAREMTGYTVRALDDDVCKTIDFYFDDDRWTIRHLDVDTGEAGLAGSVLLSPMAMTNPDRRVEAQ
jgi:hypothetical protein